MCESCVEKSAHKVGAGTSVSPDRWFTYDVVAEDPGTHARAGVLHTPHGDVPTPIFMPVGTKATVKGILPDTLERLGTKILLNNTYHLSQRPGADLVEEMGGVHEFMQWHGPILTDSGGFQVLDVYKRQRQVRPGGGREPHERPWPQPLVRGLPGPQGHRPLHPQEPLHGLHRAVRLR